MNRALPYLKGRPVFQFVYLSKHCIVVFRLRKCVTSVVDSFVTFLSSFSFGTLTYRWLTTGRVNSKKFESFLLTCWSKFSSKDGQRGLFDNLAADSHFYFIFRRRILRRILYYRLCVDCVFTALIGPSGYTAAGCPIPPLLCR